MIPKIIHYCWFGEKPIPADQISFIEEWQIINPDWRIIKWDNSSIDLNIPYLAKASGNQNWANISNYTRLSALQKHGGIYLDTDVKLLKPFDSLCQFDCFMGFESDTLDELSVNNAVMGAIAGHEFVDLCIEEINLFDGAEKANLSSPHLVTSLLKKYYGLEKYGEQVLHGIKLFPKEYFYPLPYSKVHIKENYEKFLTPNSIAIHFWNRSWLESPELLNTIDSQTRYIDEQSLYINDLVERLGNFTKGNQEDLMFLKKINSLSISTEKLSGKISTSISLSNLTVDLLKKIEEKQMLMENNSKELQNSLQGTTLIHDFFNQKILQMESAINKLTIEQAISAKENLANQKKTDTITTDIQKQLVQTQKKSNENELAIDNINNIRTEELTLIKKLEKDIQNLVANQNEIISQLLSEIKEQAAQKTTAKDQVVIERDNKLKEAEHSMQIEQIATKLAEERSLFNTQLNDKNEELEKLQFKVKTLNSYVENFAGIRKQMEDRIWLLEEIIQDMRLINRAKRVVGAYKSKVRHLIFNNNQQ